MGSGSKIVASNTTKDSEREWDENARTNNTVYSDKFICLLSLWQYLWCGDENLPKNWRWPFGSIGFRDCWSGVRGAAATENADYNVFVSAQPPAPRSVG